jgi:hypothetical protein
MSMHRKNFTPSDDALILEQPVSRIGIEKPATMLHTSPGRVMRRADELGVSLALRYHDEAIDTRAHRCTRRPATRTAEAGTRRPEVNRSHTLKTYHQ